MTRHRPLYPLPLPLPVEVVWLAGDVAVTGHVAHPDVLDVGVDLHTQTIILTWDHPSLTSCSSGVKVVILTPVSLLSITVTWQPKTNQSRRPFNIPVLSIVLQNLLKPFILSALSFI